jgi:hypothetical protein
MRFGLVGCVKEKLARAAPAGSLYTSALFRGRRHYVERSCDAWFILSALHGLVRPEQIVAPYDVTLTAQGRRERRQWSAQVIHQLQLEIVGGLAANVFEIHAGKDYRDFGLSEALKSSGASVDIPTLGLSQGQQLRFYKLARESAGGASQHGIEGLD